jgi:hypothetical protein
MAGVALGGLSSIQTASPLRYSSRRLLQCSDSPFCPSTIQTDMHMWHHGDASVISPLRYSDSPPSPPPLPPGIQTDVHMWHHEDAGVAFNVMRSAVASAPRRTSPSSHPSVTPGGGAGGGGEWSPTHFVAVPGHYNDPRFIERSRNNHDNLSLQDEYLSQESVTGWRV